MEAASTGIYVIDKVLHLLKDEAYLFQQANVDIVSLKLELESLSRLIKNTDASKWGVEAWLTEATKAAQRVEFVLDMYLLQFTELRPQRGFYRVALQRGDLNKKLKPGQALASEIQRIVEGLPVLKKWGKEKQFFSLEEKSRSTDLGFNDEDENFSTRRYENENFSIGGSSRISRDLSFNDEDENFSTRGYEDENFSIGGSSRISRDISFEYLYDLSLEYEHVDIEEGPSRSRKDLSFLEESDSFSEEDDHVGIEDGSGGSKDLFFLERSNNFIREDERVGIEEGSRSKDLSFLDNLYTFIEEDEFVGVESQKEELVSMLVGEPSRRLVISLVGIGGVGKTTLARSIVYQSEEVRRHFDFHVWINVSKSYQLENLFRDLTQMTCEDGDTSKEDLEMMQEQELISSLKQNLLTKRYLIIFDDVWQMDFWDVMNHVFPDSKNGSRIIITTRNNATVASSDICKCVQPLSKEMAWELFRKQAFESENGNCPHELLEVSSEIVRRCYGLPLVIKAMASLLSCERKVVSEWKMLLNHFNNGFREHAQLNSVVSTIFSRSYDDLPFHIRLCFLYFGIFPEDILIPDQRLFKVWIAEGFVKEETGKTLEQVVEMYLNELVNRNLVQVSHIKYDGTERMCSVHGFMHEILVSKAKQFEICQFFEEKDSTSFVYPESRRLSIYGGAINTLQITVDHSRVRSVLLFDVHGLTMTKSVVVDLFERFKLLELLDFEDAPLDDLPIEVGNLFFLKYLSLRNTKLKNLPKSVGLLLNLETLDVRNTQINELPKEIQKLRKLQHLLASAYNDSVGPYSVHGVRIKEGIGYLENLQTLTTLEAHSSGFAVMKDLKKLGKLRCLSVSKLDSHIVSALSSSIKKMNHLESLSLYSSNNLQTFDLKSISSPPPSLGRLILKCRLNKLPKWILMLQNLSILGLSSSKLTVDPLKALMSLPNLTSLLLHRAYDGEQLHFEEGSFQKLKQLVLTELHELRMIKIERGALPVLEDLTFGPSPLLNEVPSGIQHLRNLKVLASCDMANEFVRSMQPNGGSDHWKVQHIPSVLFWYRVQGRSYVSYTLGEPDLFDHLHGLSTDKNAVSQQDLQWNFCFSDEEEFASTSIIQPGNVNRLSFSSDRCSFFSDDIED